MSNMTTVSSVPELPAEICLMLDEAIRHAQTGTGDPVILQRIHHEAEQIKREVFEKNGLLDIGTPAIRELRDE